MINFKSYFSSPREFYLYSGSEPVSSDLLAFLRIFQMNEGKLLW